MRLCVSPPITLQVMHGSMELPVEEALALSAKYRFPLNETEDFAEGLAVRRCNMSGSEW
jgi:hypothetical protein